MPEGSSSFPANPQPKSGFRANSLGDYGFPISHLHTSHNTPCLLPTQNFAHPLRFYFLLGITVVPREINDNAKAHFLRGWGKQGVLWEMCKWRIPVCTRNQVDEDGLVQGSYSFEFFKFHDFFHDLWFISSNFFKTLLALAHLLTLNNSTETNSGIHQNACRSRCLISPLYLHYPCFVIYSD